MSTRLQPHPLAPDGALTALWGVADDHEAAVLRDLLVKAGLLWRCECGATFPPETDACEFDGKPRPESAKPGQAEPPKPARVLVVRHDGGFTTHTHDNVEVATIDDGDELPEGFEDFAATLGYPDPRPHVKFEYDESFWGGGDYSGTGLFAYVPLSLIIPGGLTPEQAFTEQTGLDARHIIHYSLDDLYDSLGDRLQDAEVADDDADE